MSSYSIEPRRPVHGLWLLDQSRVVRHGTAFVESRRSSPCTLHPRLLECGPPTDHCLPSGDSYTDSGFNPEGVQPNDTYPLGNPFTNSSTPPYHTFTNGPNWIQYLTFKYNESQVETYNLAVSGSTVDNSIFDEPGDADLVHQISGRFAPNYVNMESVGWTSSNALFSLFFGINDVNRSWNKQDGKVNEAIFSIYPKLLDSVCSTNSLTDMI